MTAHEVINITELRAVPVPQPQRAAQADGGVLLSGYQHGEDVRPAGACVGCCDPYHGLHLIGCLPVQGQFLLIGIQQSVLFGKFPEGGCHVMLIEAGKVAAAFEVPCQVVHGMQEDLLHVKHRIIVAVASQYCGYFPFRDAQKRLALCHLQAVVQDSCIHALFHPAQPRAGDPSAVKDALDRAAPYRVILVPYLQEQSRVDDGVRDDALIQPLIRILLLQFLLHLTPAGDRHQAQVFGVPPFPERIPADIFQALKEILLLLEYAAVSVGKYSCLIHFRSTFLFSPFAEVIFIQPLMRLKPSWAFLATKKEWPLTVSIPYCVWRSTNLFLSLTVIHILRKQKSAKRLPCLYMVSSDTTYNLKQRMPRFSRKGAGTCRFPRRCGYIGYIQPVPVPRLQVSIKINYGFILTQYLVSCQLEYTIYSISFCCYFHLFKFYSKIFQVFIPSRIFTL
ncbi:hypothetical protein IMSAGC019_00994 [Lachnospiraceae bacterium]|nr:hypothetical protein IMSAGC019_00994 [Lachnospiraceae bacterium]